jgi:hypothetical protein
MSKLSSLNIWTRFRQHWRAVVKKPLSKKERDELASYGIVYPWCLRDMLELIRSYEKRLENLADDQREYMEFLYD